MTGRQHAFDDCAPDWPDPAPAPKRPRTGIRYHPGPQSDLYGQRLRTTRITTIPLTGRYL